MERRLAAILAADVVGYSKLMGENELATLAALRSFRRNHFEPAIQAHGGTILKRMGDGWIVEFASVSSAVTCAIEIQESRSSPDPISPDPIRLRMGVHIGEIVFEDEDIYGDGINISARLEAKGVPGSVLISDTAHHSLDGNTADSFGACGEHQLKNISRPIAIWCWPPSSAEAIASQTEPGAEDQDAPGKPSIAVLPFANLSGDAEQEFFADGISEDIITALSRFPDLSVIARTTCFSYKGQAVTSRTLAEELKIRYLLEGSVRRGGDRLRISVQLVEAKSGNQIWSDRYDRNMTDFFDLQDEISATVVARVSDRLAKAEMDRVKQKRPRDLSAYEYVIRGKQHHHHATPEDNATALRLLDKAIEIDPDYAAAYAWKACTLGQAIGLGTGGDPKDLLELNYECAQKGLSLDAEDVECHRILCEFGMLRAQWDEAEHHHDMAFSLNPNGPRIVAQRGELYTKLGRAEEGVYWAEKAMELDPQAASGRIYLLARAQFAARYYRDALASYKKIAKANADHVADQAACAAMAGLPEEAQDYLCKVQSLRPDFSVDDYVARRAFKQAEDRDHLRGALLATGLPA